MRRKQTHTSFVRFCSVIALSVVIAHCNKVNAQECPVRTNAPVVIAESRAFMPRAGSIMIGNVELTVHPSEPAFRQLIRMISVHRGRPLVSLIFSEPTFPSEEMPKPGIFFVVGVLSPRDTESEVRGFYEFELNKPEPGGAGYLMLATADVCTNSRLKALGNKTFRLVIQLYVEGT